MIQYSPPAGDFVIDLVARLGDAFHYDDIETQEILVDDVIVRVATPPMLYAMKKDTARPQDRLDAASLRERSGAARRGCLMSVRKLRRIEETAAVVPQPLTGENVRAAIELSYLCGRLHPWQPPPGVHRNVSVAAAQARRRHWEAPAGVG